MNSKLYFVFCFWSGLWFELFIDDLRARSSRILSYYNSGQSILGHEKQFFRLFSMIVLFKLVVFSVTHSKYYLESEFYCIGS
jgi:hypothetical protein